MRLVRFRRLVARGMALPAVALSLAALAIPLVPTQAAATAPTPRPDVASAIAGYVWDGGGPVESYYAYNSVDASPGAVAITPVSTGTYQS